MIICDFEGDATAEELIDRRQNLVNWQVHSWVFILKHFQIFIHMLYLKQNGEVSKRMLI